MAKRKSPKRIHPRRCASCAVRAYRSVAINHPWCLDRPAHPCAGAHRREVRFNASHESPARPALLAFAGSLNGTSMYRSRHFLLFAFAFWLLRQGMPLNGAPVGRRVGVGKPAGWRARCASVRCMYMDVHSANPVARSRSRRAGCPETAPPGWPSSWLLLLGHSRRSRSLAESE